MRKLLATLSLALALPLAACGDGGTEPEPGIDGTYTLETINGGALPSLIAELDGDKLEVLDGSIVLRADGTFTDRLALRLTEAGVVSTPEEIYTGTWLKTTTGARLTPQEFEPYVVQIDGDVMSQTIGDFRLVYRR